MVDPHREANDAELFSELRALPVLDLDSESAAEIRAKAHRLLLREEPSWLAMLERIYDRVEPLLLGGTATVFLLWAVRTIALIQQH